MELQYIYTRLHVSDFQACLQFYQDVLGLKVTYLNENNYAELDTGTTKIALLKQQILKEIMGNTEAALDTGRSDRIALTFKVHDLDEAIQSLKTKGVEFLNNPWNFPDWDFVSAFFRDPEDNLIELQQLLT